MNQIESQREDYYRKAGVASGLPTMKGSYADPEVTGVGYNVLIKELGDHRVPEDWVQHPVINTEEGSNPGAPLAWGSPENPDDVVAGYGYVAADTSGVEERYFIDYHSITESMKEIDEWRRKHYGTKRCRIYRLADVYKTICIAYEKGTGIPFLNDPINTLHITDTSSLIGRVIIDVLNQTKVIDMPSAEYSKDWLYDNFKLKSFRTLDKKYSYCSVSLFEDELDIYLMKYDSRTKGPEEVEGKKVSLVFSATNESEIGDIIVSFFNESSSI